MNETFTHLFVYTSADDVIYTSSLPLTSEEWDSLKLNRFVPAYCSNL